MKIKQLDPKELTLLDLADKSIYVMYKKRNVEYDVGWNLVKLSSGVKYISEKDEYDVIFVRIEETQSEEDRLKGMSIEDLAKDEKYADLFEEKTEEPKKDPKKEPKYAKYYRDTAKEEKKTNQAVYARMMSNLDGTIWLVPKSNGAIRIEFNDKSKAEAYLKQVKRQLHYSTNSEDVLTVNKLYSLLGLAVPEDLVEITANYGWATVDFSAQLTWISESVTKTVDKPTFGFCITKRANKLKND